MPLYRRLSTADVNAVLIQTGATRVYHLHATNTTASAKYVKLYNKATAPTVGTDTPVLTFVLPANFSGPILQPPGSETPFTFTLGLGLGITGALADADTTAVAANDVVLNGRYE
jgi:hypothetical protein